MNAQDLKNSILLLAIQGKLVEQREEEGTAKELLVKIEAEKKQLIKEGIIKKQKTLREIKADEIPFDIPESWEWVRLGEVGEIVGGGTPKTGSSEFWNGGNIPWLTPADMKFVPGKYVENGERSITEKGLKGSSARLMPKGTIIYSSRAPIGYIAIANNDLATNQGFKSLVPYELRINEYMYYCLISRTNEIISRASGTTFKEISGSEFGLTVVPLPPLEEQKRIVAKIEELMPYVEKYNVAYSEVEELNKKFPEDMQKSILQYAIQGKLVEQREEDGTAEDLYKQIQEEKKKLIKEGKIKKTKALPEISEDEIPFDIPESWKWVRFSEVIDVRDGTHDTPKYVSGGIPLVTSKNLNNGEIDFENAKFISYDDAEKINQRSGVDTGDILFAMIGSIGNPVLVKKCREFSIKNMALFKPIKCELLDMEYVYWFLQFEQNFMKKKAAGGVQSFVSLTFLRNYLIPLPPHNEQKRIVRKITDSMPLCRQLIKKIV
jgi:type I restriction enzyme S subunit